ncbi:hypothetical protein NUITMVRA1_09150 [Aerococcus viridans]|nr:hypothetical protein NUITMVRA1_09150 [Aerococcus viridans]
MTYINKNDLREKSDKGIAEIVAKTFPVLKYIAYTRIFEEGSVHD